MIHPYPAEMWVTYFAWTLWIEVPLYLLALRYTKLNFLEAFTIAIGVNVFTHPALWYIFPNFVDLVGKAGWILIAETCVSLVEGLVIGLSIERVWVGLGIAVAVNTVSTLFGLYVF